MMSSSGDEIDRELRSEDRIKLPSSVGPIRKSARTRADKKETTTSFLPTESTSITSKSSRKDSAKTQNTSSLTQGEYRGITQHQAAKRSLLQSVFEIIGVFAFIAINLSLASSGIVLILIAYHWLPWLWYLILPYLAWMLLIDGGIEARGARPSAFGRAYRAWGLWDGFRQYFEGKLIKTCDLPLDKDYIFCIHPHGVYCFSFWGNMLSNPDFERKFPGIQLRPSTLPVNFYLPLWRDLLLNVGGISVDKNSLYYVLNQSEKNRLRLKDHPDSLDQPSWSPKSQAVVIAIGGAEEFQFVAEGCMDLVILKRKGFCKVALKSGCSLVPVIAFGETDIYSIFDHAFLQPFNNIIYSAFKFVLPAFYGRWYTILPHRKPLVTVVGSPIPVTKIENPSQAQVDALHKSYCLVLRKLYDAHKDSYAPARKRDMTFVR